MSGFVRFSLRLLAKWSDEPAYRQAGSLECLNLTGEFQGCSGTSLQPQKKSVLSE
jgi:hypothetical protein